MYGREVQIKIEFVIENLQLLHMNGYEYLLNSDRTLKYVFFVLPTWVARVRIFCFR